MTFGKLIDDKIATYDKKSWKATEEIFTISVPYILTWKKSIRSVSTLPSHQEVSFRQLPANNSKSAWQPHFSRGILFRDRRSVRSSAINWVSWNRKLIDRAQRRLRVWSRTQVCLSVNEFFENSPNGKTIKTLSVSLQEECARRKFARPSRPSYVSKFLSTDSPLPSTMNACDASKKHVNFCVLVEELKTIFRFTDFSGNKTVLPTTRNHVTVNSRHAYKFPDIYELWQYSLPRMRVSTSMNRSAPNKPRTFNFRLPVRLLYRRIDFWWYIYTMRIVYHETSRGDIQAVVVNFKPGI